MYDLVRQPANPTAPVALKWFTDPQGHFLKELVPFDKSGGIAHDLPLFFDPENNVQVSGSCGCVVVLVAANNGGSNGSKQW